MKFGGNCLCYATEEQPKQIPNLPNTYSYPCNKLLHSIVSFNDRWIINHGYTKKDKREGIANIYKQTNKQDIKLNQINFLVF